MNMFRHEKVETGLSMKGMNLDNTRDFPMFALQLKYLLMTSSEQTMTQALSLDPKRFAQYLAQHRHTFSRKRN